MRRGKRGREAECDNDVTTTTGEGKNEVRRRDDEEGRNQTHAEWWGRGNFFIFFSMRLIIKQHTYRTNTRCTGCIITSVLKASNKFDTWLNLVASLLLIALPHYPAAQKEACSTSGGGGGEGRMERACRLSVTPISRCVSEFDICLICMWHTHIHKNTHTHTLLNAAS